MPAGSTVAELLTKAFSETDMVCDGLRDGYIKSLTKAGVTLSQYDQGPNSGWMYQVNGSSPNVGIGDYTLKQADQVLLYYTADWTKEDSTQHWGGGSGKADSKTPDQLPFADVAANSYYYDAVLWATGQGVTTGTSDTTFGPDAVCTRAQIVTFLWRAAGSRRHRPALRLFPMWHLTVTMPRQSAGLRSRESPAAPLRTPSPPMQPVRGRRGSPSSGGFPSPLPLSSAHTFS